MASTDVRPGVPGVAKVFGIIGYPLERTLSPAIQNAAFRSAGLDWIYSAFRVAPGEGSRAVEAMRVLGLGGLSVTIPHKESVLSNLDSLSPVASVTGAVNTISWSADGTKLVGDNTDVAGFVSGLRSSLGISLDERNVVVLGSGGAARAVVWAAVQEGAHSVTVIARRPSRAAALIEAIADSVGRRRSIPTLRAAAMEGSALDEACKSADLLVNATPVGSDGSSVPVHETAIHEGLYVYDLVYFPPRTPLVEVGISRGAGGAGGLEMLIHQGGRQFEIWSGMDAPLDTMRRAAEAAIGAALQNPGGPAEKSGLK